MRTTSLVLVASMAFAACRAAPLEGLRVGEPAPGFTLPAVGGGEISLSDYAGVRPVLLFFHMAVG